MLNTHAVRMELFTLPPVNSPAEWLAWDEALLAEADTASADGKAYERLWFWESTSPFIVLGYGQKADSEANINVCDIESIPILRRCSGGGAVVQGAGCLNYSLVLAIPEVGPLTTIATTNSWIMERNRRAIATLLKGLVTVRGHTDLALVRSGHALKFSGNAQRRKRRALLFHGTFLRNFDLTLISRWLQHPSAEPDYRGGRSHTEFVTNSELNAEAIRDALIREWGAIATAGSPSPDAIRELMRTRYGQSDWHRSLISS